MCARSGRFSFLVSREDFAVHIIGWIIFGLIVGALARFLMPGPQPMGLIMTCLIGIAGSFVGGTIANALQGGSLADPVPAGWIGAILGTILLLFIYRRFAGRSL